MAHIFLAVQTIGLRVAVYKNRVGADLGLHYVKSPKVPFRVTLAISCISSVFWMNLSVVKQF